MVLVTTLLHEGAHTTAMLHTRGREVAGARRCRTTLELATSLLLVAGMMACISVPPQPPLVRATLAHDTARVAELLQAGADPNVKNSTGQSVLQLAAFGSEHEIVRLLLENGATVEARSETHGTPLMSAVSTERGSDVSFERLLEAGADPQASTIYGKTILMVASASGRLSAIRKLIALGVPVNVADVGGNTALSNAAWGGKGEAVGILLESGADPNLRDSFGRTPARVANDEGHWDVAAQLAKVTKPMPGDPEILDPAAAGLWDAGLQEAVEAATKVANDLGLAVRSAGKRVFVEAQRRGEPVTLTIRFFRRDGQIVLASSLRQSAALFMRGEGQKVEREYYTALFAETSHLGLAIHADPNASALADYP